mgnify:FL=1
MDSVIISDEWNFIYQQELFPLDDNVLLMYYDIIAHPQHASLFDYYRAKLFRYFKKYNIIVLRVLEKCKIILRCKTLKVTDLRGATVSPFKLDKIYYLQKSLVPHLLKNDDSHSKVSDSILLNFYHERESMFSFLNYSTFAFDKIENESILIKDRYRILIKQYMHNILETISLPSEHPVDYKDLLQIIH